MMNVYHNDMIKFLSTFCSVNQKKITMMTSLRDDLGVDGEDAEELMLAYSKKFNVDLSNFKFDRYFCSEYPSSILDFFYGLFCKSHLDTVLVKDLIHFAELGYWLEEKNETKGN